MNSRFEDSSLAALALEFAYADVTSSSPTLPVPRANALPTLRFPAAASMPTMPAPPFDDHAEEAA